MCGLIGLATTNIFGNDLKFVRQALVCDTFRGPHSTGIIAVNGGAKPFIYKRVLDGTRFVETKAYQKLEKEALAAQGTVAIMGHNRWATQGKIVVANAHPFRHNNITGMHNGTLSGHSALAGGKGKRFDVDSEAIIYALSISKGEFVPVLEELTGSFALVWHDYHDKKIRFARNEERTLAIATSQYGNTIAWASEKLMLEWLLDRNYPNQEFTIRSLPVGEMWSYDLTNKTDLASTKEVEKFVPKSQHTYRVNRRTHSTTRRTAGGTGSVTGTHIKDASQKRRFPTKTFLAPMAHNLTEIEVETVGLGAGDTERVILDDFKYNATAGIAGTAYGKLECSPDIKMEVNCDDTLYDKGKIIEVRIPRRFSKRNTVYFLYCHSPKEIVDTIPVSNNFVYTKNDCISLGAFEAAIKGDCAWCSSPIFVTQAEDCYYIDNGGTHASVYCPDCTNSKVWRTALNAH